MSAYGDVREAHHELKQAIRSRHLSEPLRNRAQELLSQIERPVRLGILGLPGSGKSSLMNLLLGTDVIPNGLRLPTILLSHGAEPSATCTLPDGSTQIIAGDDIPALAALNPAFIEASLPLPALTKLSMLEVVAGADTTEQTRALHWACKRIDIALWCSSGIFDEEEQVLWRYAPELIQDHAFLMLTKTDAVSDPVEQDVRIAKARASGQHVFKQVLPIGTKSAIAARRPDGSVDKEALRASGGIALISAILRDVEAGRQNTIDQAHVFLRQIDFAPVARAEVKSLEPPQKPAGDISAPDPVDTPQPKAEAPVTTPSFKPASRQIVEQAVEQLTAEAVVMREALSSGTLDDATVIETCVDTVTWLADYLSNSGAQDDPVYEQSCDAALDAADLVQLIQLETGDNVATDALSLMVQLKQDMQTRLAA